MFIYIEMIPRHRDRQRLTTIVVEGKIFILVHNFSFGTIFAFGFSKKYDLSLLSLEGQVLDRCPAFNQLASVDAHLCSRHLGQVVQGCVTLWR